MNTYKRVSDSFIKTKLSTRLYSQVYDSCYNLSAILGDIEGYIPGSISKQLSTLRITSPGLVSGCDLSVTHPGILPPDRFYSEVSDRSYQLYLECASSDLSRILPGASKDYSKLMTLSADLLPDIQTAVYVIYLESFAIYLSLLEANPTVEGVTSGDIIRVCNNIECIDSKMCYLNTTSYDLIQTLRDLERTLAYVSSLNNLFNQTLSEKLSDYEQWRGGLKYE